MGSSALPPVILASESPRRRELLSRILPRFEVVPAGIDEEAAGASAPTPGAAALASALAKARAIHATRPEALVLGCDTVVIVDGRALGKPRDEADAVAMVLALAGRSHEVATGIALVLPGAEGGALEAVERTTVVFRPFGEQQARAYVAQGESIDKAGAYGIQGLGSLLVERIEGCYYNVVGLPLHRLGRMLEEAGFELFPP